MKKKITMTSELVTFLAQLKAVVAELTKDSSVGTQTWPDNLDRGQQLCDSLLELGDCTGQTAVLTEIEGLAISLWNFSVNLKTKGQVSETSNAKLRHIAFSVLSFLGQKTENEANLHRLVMMGLKSGRAWLDCGTMDRADKILTQTEKFIRRLQGQLLEKKAGVPEGCGGQQQGLDRQATELQQDLFTLHCYRAESSIGVSKSDEGLQHMMMAKELVQLFPKQAGFLSMLCYNAGVELYQQKLFNPTIIWLRESYDLGKGLTSVSSKNQARTLRLLANVYLEHKPEENLQNALNAVSLANNEYRHPAGLFLMLKILLLQKASDEALKRSIEDLVKVPELTVDLGLHTLQLVKEHNRQELVLWLIEALMKRFDHATDVGKLLITNTEVLIEASMNKEAKEFVEFCITANHTGRQLDFPIKKRFHILFWEQAASAFEKEDWQEALEWYNYSLALYSKSDPGDLTLAKLHRNRANCYIHLQLLDKAKDALMESLECDVRSAQTHFILYKLAVAQADSTAASESLKKLCDLQPADVTACGAGDRSEINDLIALAAQHALENDHPECACVALESLVSSSSDRGQVLKALRCLIRIKLTASEDQSSQNSEMSDMIGYIQTGVSKLTDMIPDTKPGQQDCLQAEADWFIKIAWNLALQCEEKPVQIMTLYKLCSQLLCLSVQDDQCLSRQKTCLVMSVASGLQVARTTTDLQQKTSVLEECLGHIEACRQLCQRIREHSIGIADTCSKETDVLLLLYEFEARVHLKDSSVEGVLETALAMSGLDPTTFEAMAALANEPPVQNRSVAVRALRVAIRKHLQLQNPDILKCSKLFHSLIQLCLSAGSSHDLTGREEAWNYYTEILDIIDTRGQGCFPEMEVVWLMTKAWNCGINFYSCNRFPDAERWCSLSMKMLKYLDSTRSSYQDHMTSVYGEILYKVTGNTELTTSTDT